MGHCWSLGNKARVKIPLIWETNVNSKRIQDITEDEVAKANKDTKRNKAAGEGILVKPLKEL